MFLFHRQIWDSDFVKYIYKLKANFHINQSKYFQIKIFTKYSF